MKNNSFQIPNNNPILEINIIPIKEHKRAKSNQSKKFDNLIIDNNKDELQIIEPFIHKNQSSISKILSFINYKSNDTLDKNNKDRKEDSKCHFNKKQKSKNNKKNIIILNSNKKINFYNIPVINISNRKSKSISIKKVKCKSNNNNNSKIIPYKKSIINSEKINHKKKEKFKMNKKYSNELLTDKENISTINIYNTSGKNSISTDINSSSSKVYSPNLTFGNKPKSKNRKIKIIPQKFIYVKKANNNSKIIKSNNCKQIEIKYNYNKFKNDLNKIKIDDICDNYINYNIEENENTDEKINEKKISYVGKFKTFEEIEKKNLNMMIIKKILNNHNLNIQTYNFNSHKNNENKIFLYNNEEQNYNNLKTATFALFENENKY